MFGEKILRIWHHGGLKNKLFNLLFVITLLNYDILKPSSESQNSNYVIKRFPPQK